MRVKAVAYVGSYNYTQPFPDDLGPEFVFLGRSNVGKSSLINTLVGRRNIARTSNTPGKTRTANFYSVNGAFCFVDVPGYGYAKMAKTERDRWQKFLRNYLIERKPLRGIVHLLDIRHKPSADDKETSRMLQEVGKPVCLVFNKSDKVGRGEIHARIARHLEALTASDATAVVSFPGGAGKRSLWAWIEDRLSA